MAFHVDALVKAGEALTIEQGVMFKKNNSKIFIIFIMAQKSVIY